MSKFREWLENKETDLNETKLDKASFTKGGKMIYKSLIKDDIFEISLNDSKYYKFKIKKSVADYLNDNQNTVNLFVENLALNVASFIEKEVDAFENKMYLYS